jgi:two-component system cell cycle sensor histidine kinase/response regulator CckA
MSVLVLTSDAEAARSLCTALERSGQTASWEISPDRATARLREVPPLVLVADIAVGSHPSVVAELKLGAPWARVVLMGDDTLRDGGEPSIVAKPFDASALAQVLAREGELAELDRSRHVLRERVERLTLLVDECFEAIVGLSAEGIILSWNPGAASVYGYTADEIIGCSIEMLDAEPELTCTRLAHDDRRVAEVRRRHKNGSEILVLLSLSRVSRGTPEIHFAEVSLDITERRQLERNLEHAERLAAIGRIAAGMAHEINNPLAVIGASAAYVSEVAARIDDPELAGCASDIEMAVERIGSFVQHVCGFARRERPHMADTSIHTALDIALRMIRPRAKDRAVEVSVEQSSGVIVPHDPPRLAQAVLNLLSNAVDAAAGGGRHVLMRVVADDDSVRIEVDDDGLGITAELAERLFEPFTTTKPFGQGTGLGLPITRQIAHDHGGEVRLHPLPGGGTRASFELPRFRATSYRLLVVEDDPAVRRALATDLRREGFDVSTAASLDQACEVVRTRRIHVIIADAHLPDPVEEDPLATLARESPTSRRLVMSADPGSVRGEDADHVLTKPWNRSELLQVTRRLCLRGERHTKRSSLRF